MQYCNNCGEQVDDDATFCSNCGDAVTTTQEPRSGQPTRDRRDGRQPPPGQQRQPPQGGPDRQAGQPGASAPQRQPRGQQQSRQQPQRGGGPPPAGGGQGSGGPSRRHFLVGGAAAVALAGGGWYLFVRETYPDDPIGVVELEWEAWEESDFETYDEIYHSESPERDSEWWTQITEGDEEFGLEDGSEWTLEERELVEETADEATVREVYTIYRPNVEGMDEEIYGRATRLVTLRTEDGDWKIWEQEIENWEELEGSPDSA